MISVRATSCQGASREPRVLTTTKGSDREPTSMLIRFLQLMLSCTLLLMLAPADSCMRRTGRGGQWTASLAITRLRCCCACIMQEHTETNWYIYSRTSSYHVSSLRSLSIKGHCGTHARCIAVVFMIWHCETQLGDSSEERVYARFFTHKNCFGREFLRTDARCQLDLCCSLDCSLYQKLPSTVKLLPELLICKHGRKYEKLSEVCS
jgi:hypothetical protein